ncbi:hypothetical protein CAPTEDRAFT_183324 [Capitella teleta]|uniref:Transcription initiation factor TFIID subunit 8 n=1 Tax=Capitella teleta TaxID=283909 RepID=R7VJ93_CAPTE|nr:hypothetical protein CAPTEDRAFT_183324 [Capitella teleta]|eukprot:ELU15820.1 hypothetical protein CAPTEDRAFT_183324 [Capitella teleta]
MASASEHLTTEAVCRRAMKVAVSLMCTEAGFALAEDAALETLIEMVISFLTELGRSSRALSELSCRTEVMPGDVALALIEMGQRIDELVSYAKSTKHNVFIPPGHAPQQPPPRILQVGEKKGHPTHIPDYLPSFPDPHTYITTSTHKAPMTEYKLVREKAASQKRDVERALTRFIAKTGETESLFQDDPYAFPLIANRPKPLPYLESLLPKDEEGTAQDEEARIPGPGERTAATQAPPPSPPPDTPTKAENKSLNDSKTEANETESENPIDNPYLRAITMPKLKGVNRKAKW